MASGANAMIALEQQHKTRRAVAEEEDINYDEEEGISDVKLMDFNKTENNKGPKLKI